MNNLDLGKQKFFKQRLFSSLEKIKEISRATCCDGFRVINIMNVAFLPLSQLMCPKLEDGSIYTNNIFTVSILCFLKPRT